MNWKTNTIAFLVATTVALTVLFSVDKKLPIPSVTVADQTPEPWIVVPRVQRPESSKNPNQFMPTPTSKAAEAFGTLAAEETKAFNLAQNLETREEARQLFLKMVQVDPSNTLASQMLTELSSTKVEKEQTADILLSTFAACSSCNDLGLIAADLLLTLDRLSEATLLTQQLTKTVTEESERRHLAALQIKLGDEDAARTNLEKVKASRKRLKTRRGTSSPAEITWEKIDNTELSSLTPKG